MNYFTGEFLGTLFLIVFGGGVVANNLLGKSKGENAGWLSITIGWGLAVMLGVFVAKSAGSPQADLNPAVTLAKVIFGNIYTPMEALTQMAAQVLGAFTGAIVVFLAYLPHWKETSDANKKLGVFATGPAIRSTSGNLITEIIGTIVLVVGLGAIFGSATAGSPANGLGPYLVGMLVWAIGLSLGGPTGYAINPARDFGPRLAHFFLPIPGKRDSDWSYAWIPVVGPMIGGALGALICKAVF